TITSRARAMSVVMWATTVGSVAGPNLTAAGAHLGPQVGVPELAGPYLFSVVAFAAAATVLGMLFRPVPATGTTGPAQTSDAAISPGAVGALSALRWAAGHPTARFAVVLIA